MLFACVLLWLPQCGATTQCACSSAVASMAGNSNCCCIINLLFLSCPQQPLLTSTTDPDCQVFKQLSDSEVILAVVTKKARPTFPPDVPSRYKFLAERCWSEMMELRPSLQVGLQKASPS